MSSEFMPSVQLYHASGALCTLPLSGADYAEMARSVDAAIAAGFSAAAPGLDAGEQLEQIGYMLRREKVNSDNTETPVIDLYSANEAVKFKVFSIYLNRPEDVAAFEKACGIPLANLRVFPGTAAPERGANKQSDAFITNAPKPFGVVLKANPKYNPDETDAAKKKPKRLFVRWAEQKTTAPATPTTTATAPAAITAPRTPNELVDEYRFCVDDTAFARLEAKRKEFWPMASDDAKRAMKTASDAARQRMTESVPA
jgi:hypothetical protein